MWCSTRGRPGLSGTIRHASIESFASPLVRMTGAPSRSPVAMSTIRCVTGASIPYSTGGTNVMTSPTASSSTGTTRS